MTWFNPDLSKYTPDPFEETKDTTAGCEWHLDDDEAGAWESACGQLWCFEEGTPKENEMNFCPFCGRLLTQHPKVCASNDNSWEEP